MISTHHVRPFVPVRTSTKLWKPVIVLQSMKKSELLFYRAGRAGKKNKRKTVRSAQQLHRKNKAVNGRPITPTLPGTSLDSEVHHYYRINFKL